MKKYSRLALMILVFVFFSHATRNIQATELVTNGGFETGDFTGWTVVTAGSNWYPFQVTSAGGGFMHTSVSLSSPLYGTKSAWNGFCCNTTNNPEYIQQNVTIPAGQTASFHWWDKIQSNLTEFCTVPACGANTYQVQILNPANNAVLETPYVFVANGGANYNTGWIGHAIMISQYAGQTIRIRFATSYVSSMSGHLNGPGRAEIDGVSVQSPALVPTAANVSIGGRILSSNGNGIRNVVVSLTDALGNTRSTLSSTFGYYRFDAIPAGQAVVVSVRAKSYNFSESSRLYTLQDDLYDANFFADVGESLKE